MKKLLPLLLLISITVATPLSAQSNQEVAQQMEQYINQVQQQWQIPGMAVSLVKNGEMFYSKGFGTKELGKNASIDGNTVFQVGSVSKSFTAAVIASLVDEGKLSWQDTVKNILPDFRMYDRWVEENLQVKDIMTHHTGLQGQLGTYIGNMGYNRDDIYNMFRLLKPTYSFRGGYEYNNITFIIAARIIEKLTGKSWEENVRERIFEPLGMNSSTLNGDGFAAAKNVAVPHEVSYQNEALKIEPLYGTEQALDWLTAIGPAGSVCSSVNDMAKYIAFHLAKGKVGDKQVISEDQMNYVRRGHTITSQDSVKVTMYGHCWFIEQNSRYRVYFHTGTTWGFTAICAFIPEIDAGMMVLVNCDQPAEARYALMRRFIDIYKGFPETDYSTESFDKWMANNRKNAEERAKKEVEIVREAAPAYDLLTGTYNKDYLFGKAVVTLENGELYITCGPKGWKSKMKHVNGNKFSFRMDGNAFDISFQLDKEGAKCISLDIDFGYTENFGPWPKVS